MNPKLEQTGAICSNPKRRRRRTRSRASLKPDTEVMFSSGFLRMSNAATLRFKAWPALAIDPLPAHNSTTSRSRSAGQLTTSQGVKPNTFGAFVSPSNCNFSLAMAATCTRTPRHRHAGTPRVAWEKWLHTVLRNRSLLKFACFAN